MVSYSSLLNQCKEDSYVAKCEVCGKGRTVGNNVSHANNRTKKIILPNIQRAVITIDGRTKRSYVCTRCLRTSKTAKAV